MLRSLRVVVVLGAALGATACSGDKELSIIERTEVHRSEIQELEVINATPDTIVVEPVNTATAPMKIAPGEKQILTFFVKTLTEPKPSAGAQGANIKDQLEPAEPIGYLRTQQIGGRLDVSRTGGEVWSYDFNVLDCENPSWHDRPANAAKHPLSIEGRPQFNDPVALCPRP